MKKLLYQYNNTYNRSISKNLINADYWALTENIETNSKYPKFKVSDRVRITKYKNIFSKDYTENWPREIFIIYSALKTYSWTFKLKRLNGGKIIGSLHEKELLLLSKLEMSYYPHPDSNIRDKVKVVLDLSNYANKKELDHGTGVDKSDLAAKKDFIAVKPEVDKLDINKLINVATRLNNLQKKRKRFRCW